MFIWLYKKTGVYISNFVWCFHFIRIYSYTCHSFIHIDFFAHWIFTERKKEVEVDHCRGRGEGGGAGREFLLVNDILLQSCASKKFCAKNITNPQILLFEMYLLQHGNSEIFHNSYISQVAGIFKHSRLEISGSTRE